MTKLFEIAVGFFVAQANGVNDRLLSLKMKIGTKLSFAHAKIVTSLQFYDIHLVAL